MLACWIVSPSAVLMCLIVLAWRRHPVFDCVLAANRDEFHARPTEPAHWWNEPSPLFGGRDIQAGGAWCAVGPDGRFAAVTNVREPEAAAGHKSRGLLVRQYLESNASARQWAEQIHDTGADYSPFNLLVADRESLWFVSNRGSRRLLALAPGIYAISNGHWGDHWPKTDRAEAGLRDVLDRWPDDGKDDGRASDTLESTQADDLFDLLAERDPAPAAQVPSTGVAIEQEIFLSPIFIRSPSYGTRASTVMARSAQHVTFYERGFDAGADVAHRIEQHWRRTSRDRKDGST